MTEIVWYKTYNSKYFINFEGQVRTFDRCDFIPYGNSMRWVERKGKVLKSIRMNNGYYYIDLCDCGKIKRESVHRLMIKTFLNIDLKNKHVHHIDGLKKNNSISNLEVMDSKIHCSEHNLKRTFKNKTGYRGVSEYYPGRYRGSIQRSGEKTMHTKVYNNPKDAYEEIQSIKRLK